MWRTSNGNEQSVNESRARQQSSAPAVRGIKTSMILSPAKMEPWSTTMSTITDTFPDVKRDSSNCLQRSRSQRWIIAACRLAQRAAAPFPPQDDSSTSAIAHKIPRARGSEARVDKANTLAVIDVAPLKMISPYRDKCRANHALRRINFYITRPQFVRVDGFPHYLIRDGFICLMHLWWSPVAALLRRFKK